MSGLHRGCIDLGALATSAMCHSFRRYIFGPEEEFSAGGPAAVLLEHIDAGVHPTPMGAALRVVACGAKLEACPNIGARRSAGVSFSSR